MAEPEPKLTDEIVVQNAKIADGNADSTHDGGHRPPGMIIHTKNNSSLINNHILATIHLT